MALCSGYSDQLAARGDLDPTPFTKALMTILEGRGRAAPPAPRAPDPTPIADSRLARCPADRLIHHAGRAGR